MFIFKPLKKIKYKSELNLIKNKLDFLTEEALCKRSTKADIVFWDSLLDRLFDIKKENVLPQSEEYYKYYKNVYDKYIETLKEK